MSRVNFSSNCDAGVTDALRIAPDSTAATALRVIEIEGTVKRLVKDFEALDCKIDTLAQPINDISHFGKALDRAYTAIAADRATAENRWTQHLAEVLRKEEKSDKKWDDHLKEYKDQVKFSNRIMGGLMLSALIIGAIATFAYNAVNSATTAREKIVATHDLDQRANVSRFEINETKQAETSASLNALQRQAPK